jgi:hypothetical protein
VNGVPNQEPEQANQQNPGEVLIQWASGIFVIACQKYRKGKRANQQG